MTAASGAVIAVGAENDSAVKIVAAESAQIGRSGSVVLRADPIRGTFTSSTPGLMLFTK